MKFSAPQTVVDAGNSSDTGCDATSTGGKMMIYPISLPSNRASDDDLHNPASAQSAEVIDIFILSYHNNPGNSAKNNRGPGMQTEAKITCSRGELGIVTLSVVLDAKLVSNLTAKRLREIDKRLKRRKHTHITDFGCVRLNTQPVSFMYFANVGLYAKDWEMARQLSIFRDEIEKITGFPCCIDASQHGKSTVSPRPSAEVVRIRPATTR
jgi:hypothetical protein